MLGTGRQHPRTHQSWEQKLKRREQNCPAIGTISESSSSTLLRTPWAGRPSRPGSDCRLTLRMRTAVGREERGSGSPEGAGGEPGRASLRKGQGKVSQGQRTEVRRECGQHKTPKPKDELKMTPSCCNRHRSVWSRGFSGPLARALGWQEEAGAGCTSLWKKLPRTCSQHNFCPATLPRVFLSKRQEPALSEVSV